MHGARRFADLGDIQIPEDGARRRGDGGDGRGSALAHLGASGKRYMMATMSDPSGQFVATCFDDVVAGDLEEAARNGGCGLLTVELDRRAGEETPRVTIKRIQPFESLANTHAHDAGDRGRRRRRDRRRSARCCPKRAARAAKRG